MLLKIFSLLFENTGLSVNTGIDAFCPGQDSWLYVVGDPSGGESPYFYEWYYDVADNGLDPADELIASGFDEDFIAVSEFGTYYLVITDTNECSISQALTLNWSLDIGLDIESIITPCFGECDGVVTFVPDGSFNAFSFDDWDLYYAVADIDGDGINNLDDNGNGFRR